MSCSACASQGVSCAATGTCKNTVSAPVAGLARVAAYGRSGFVSPAPQPSIAAAFLEKVRPRGLGQTAPITNITNGAIPSSTAMSVAGAAAVGLFGWWVAGQVYKRSENAQLVGAAAGAIAGLVIF